MIDVCIYIYDIMDNLTTNMKNHVVRQILDMRLDQRALIIHTPGGNSIVTKYVIGKTSVNNVIRTLEKKFQLAFNNGETHTPMKNMILCYKNTYLKDINIDISKYGINDLVETVHLQQSGKNTMYYNPNELEKIRKNMSERMKRVKNAEINIKTLTGRTITTTVPEDVTGLELMVIVNDREGIPVGQFRILHQSFEVSETSTLLDSYYKNLIRIKNSRFVKKYPKKIIKDPNNSDEVSIINDQTCHIIMALRGGMYSESSGKNGNYQPIRNILHKVHDILTQDEDIGKNNPTE